MTATIWRHHPRVAWELADDSLTCYLVNADGGSIIVLEANAAMIWESLPGSVPEVATTVADAFELDSASIIGDVESFLAELERQGLVIEQ